MAQVEFHTGVADPLLFTCRLLRKASRQGARLRVSAPAPVLTQLDRALWTFDERDFVPHLRVSGPADDPRLPRTPIWLHEADTALPGDAPTIQVNLGAALTAQLPQVERLIEIVGDDADEAQAARARWRDYKARGHTVIHHPAAGA